MSSPPFRRSTPSDLASIATLRQTSLFAADMAKFRPQLHEAISGRRILAIGAAGSIGSATVSTISEFNPSALHVIDQNENELAELVRTLRSRPAGLSVEDFRTLPLDFGSTTMRLFLTDQKAYDLVLNFAAIKHVRSEKDYFSMLQMLDTNLLKQARLLTWLKERDFRGRYFSVSTDKAANPSSFMGATKRLMEHVMFSGEAVGGLDAGIVSARFANVAFSNGSLLQSFLRRLEQSQPLAVPVDTRRYFVSMAESGELCTLAATCAPHGHIVIPKLSPEDNLVLLDTIAYRFLETCGLEPEVFHDEAEARLAVEQLSKRGAWPVLLTQLDTAGEKPFEEFIGDDESVVDGGFLNLELVRYKNAEAGAVSRFLNSIEGFFAPAKGTAPLTNIDKDILKDLVAMVEPSFAASHRASDKSLDSRI